MKLFKYLCLICKYAGAGIFGATFVYWGSMSFLHEDIANRGGFLFSLAPLALAIVSYLVFGHMARWADRQDLGPN